MTDPQDKPPELGIYGRPTGFPRFSAAELVAAALGVVWAAAVVGNAIALPEGETRDLPLVLTALAAVLPLALFWAAAATLRALRLLSAETARLQSAVDGLRHTWLTTQQTQAAVKPPSLEKRLEEIARAQRQTDAVLASLIRPEPAAPQAPPPAPVEEQPALAFETSDEDSRPPLSVTDFSLALNFPDSPDDQAGIRALRLALADHNVAKLIRAAQDVLTLLSSEGIYMDDLAPDRARPEIWRRFAAGERGRVIAGLGGIRDRAALSRTATRMREDPVFRDAAHHFLRCFDRTFASFENSATDAELAALADTRTARAFMLFGRVSGTFD